MGLSKHTNAGNRIEQSRMRATWVAASAAWVAAIVSIISTGYGIYSSRLAQERLHENFQIVYARVMSDVPSPIIEKAGASPDATTGLMKSYAEFYLSNNGEITISVLMHQIEQVDEYSNKRINRFPIESKYYIRNNDTYEVRSYPLILQPGYSQSIYIPVQITLAPKPYSMIKERFGGEMKQGLSLFAIRSFLDPQGIDLYGNSVVRQADGSPNVLVKSEEVFNATFTSSRQIEKSYLFSIYAYNNLYFTRSP